MLIDFCATNFLAAVDANGSEKKLLIVLLDGHITQKDALTHFSMNPDSPMYYSGKLSSISDFSNFDWYKVCYLHIEGYLSKTNISFHF